MHEQNRPGDADEAAEQQPQEETAKAKDEPRKLLDLDSRTTRVATGFGRGRRGDDAS